MDLTVGGLAEVTEAQDLRMFAEKIAMTHQGTVTELGGGLG